MSQLHLPIGKLPPAPLPGTHGLVVLSGGQDSVTCLGFAEKCYEKVSAICFDYGQSHHVEIAQAEKIAKMRGIDLVVITVDSLNQLGNSALIDGGDVNAPHPYDSKLPASYVPNRNAIFMTLAHAQAQKIGAQFVVTGVSQADFSGYPDCRKVFIKKLEQVLNLGYNTNIRFITPLSHLSKAETFALADEVGYLGLVIKESHTCYEGNRYKLNAYGYGCDRCAACILRRKGYAEFIAGGNNNNATG